MQSGVLNFSELKKNLKKDFSQFPLVKIALLGDSPTQLLNQALKGYAFTHGWNTEIWEADFDQIERQILDPDSDFYKQSPDFVLLFPSVQKLRIKFYQLSKEKQKGFANDITHQWRMLCSTLQQKLNTKVLLMNFAPYDDGVFGSFSSKTPFSFTSQVRAINVSLDNLSIEFKNLFLVDVNSMHALVGNDSAISSSIYINSGIVFNLDFLPRVTLEICQIIGAIKGRFHKCLILDLDNTLWGGIVGDDGWENLEIGDLGIGKAFTQIQSWAKQLKSRGIILCVCSKNDESIAKEVFEKHPDMKLRLDDVAVFVANWKTKVENIRFIQSVLNIGFDSMVFIDDNPFERNIVRTGIPELFVPELPEDPAEYLSFLESLHLFETASLSEEDETRTKQYQEEAKRTVVQSAFANEGEFLESLDMKAEVNTFSKYNIPRVAQLSQRSNQFNLRTIRYTEDDIEQIGKNPDYTGLAFSLQDKYGDYGLISLIILRLKNNQCFIDTWLMSCRVLKRGMEQFVLNSIVKIALAKGFDKIYGEYIPTAKNSLVKDHYSSLGFEFQGDNKWVLTLKNYIFHKNFIAPA